MKTFTACILLTLAAAAHCMPLAEVTETDEALAEVWTHDLSLSCYACVIYNHVYSGCYMYFLNRTKAGACVMTNPFFVAELSEKVL